MTADQIALFSLWVAVASFFLAATSIAVSIIAIRRDKFVLAISAVPFESPKGTYWLHVRVANSGIRPISVTHAFLVSSNHTGVYRNFVQEGSCLVDVGEVKTCQVSPSELSISWSSAEELRTIKVYVLDATGTKHLAKWDGIDAI